MNNDIEQTTMQSPIALPDTALIQLADSIADIVSQTKVHIAVSVNSAMVETYWHIGRHIVEFEQNGEVRAKYGDALLPRLSKVLGMKLGKGFSRPNLNFMRKFYLLYPNCQTVSNKLSWSHICELVTIDEMVEYATYGVDTNLFISKYELFLPNKEELRKMITKITAE